MKKEEERNKKMGRRKIAIEKIEKRAARNVAFSKRRTGAFKKAEQLCKLCGAQVAIIVYSPADKPYVFGYPDAEMVLNCFLNSDAAVNTDTGACSSAMFPVGQVGFGMMEGDEKRDPDASEVGGVWWDAEMVFDRFLNSDAAVNTDMGTGSSALFPLGQVCFGRMEGEERGDADGSEVGEVWWDAPVEKMGLEELEMYGDYLEELMRKAGVRAGMMESYSNAGACVASGQLSHYQPEIPVEIDQEDFDLDFSVDGEYFRFNIDFGLGL